MVPGCNLLKHTRVIVSIQYTAKSSCHANAPVRWPCGPLYAELENSRILPNRRWRYHRGLRLTQNPRGLLFGKQKLQQTAVCKYGRRGVVGVGVNGASWRQRGREMFCSVAFSAAKHRVSIKGYRWERVHGFAGRGEGLHRFK